jgi:eukaryotic-like serine/threonine-protein kinase
MGLSLYGVRRRPLIGRHALRDRLWRALMQASAGEAQQICLRGAAGTGKSRLAQWLAERAHEVGAADVLVARHRPAGGDAPAEMVNRHLRTTPETVREASRSAWLALGGNAADGRALAEAVGDSQMDARTRGGVILRYLVALSRQRPVLLWVDDAQWCSTAMQVLIASTRRLAERILVVATLREEGDADPRWQRIETLQLAPLALREHRTFVRSLLRLSAPLETSVVRHTLGQPLFAIHLVADWVSRGVLRWDEHGRYGLAQDQDTPVPTRIEDLWTRQVAELQPTDRRLLELAAVAGPRLALHTWRSAAESCDLSWPEGILDRLARAGLGRADEQEFQFTHGALAEAIAAQLEHPAAAHRALAHALAADGGHPATVGRHLLEAGEFGDAIGPLMEAAGRFHDRGERTGVETALEQCNRALLGTPVPKSDERWGRFRLQLLRLADYRGTKDPDDLPELLRDAREHGWHATTTGALLAQGRKALMEGRVTEADHLLAQAEQWGDTHGCSFPFVHMMQARVAIQRGDMEACQRCLEKALDLAGDSTYIRQRARINLAFVAAEQGRYAEARATLDGLFTPELTVDNEVQALHALAFVASRTGDMAAAIAHLEDALQLVVAMDAAYAAVTRLELADTHLENHDPDAAEAHLDQIDDPSPLRAARVRFSRSTAALLRDRPDEARRWMVEALALAQGMDRVAFERAKVDQWMKLAAPHKGLTALLQSFVDGAAR